MGNAGVLKGVQDFEVVGRRRRGRLKTTWKRQVGKQIGLKKRSGAMLFVNFRET